MKKRGKKRFVGISRNVLWAMLLFAAALTTYAVANAAIVSHSPSSISPQGAGSGLDADMLQGLTAADIISASEGGNADTLEGLSVADIVSLVQARIFQSCPAKSAIRAINADGSVVCENVVSTVTTPPPSTACIPYQYRTSCTMSCGAIGMSCVAGYTYASCGGSGSSTWGCTATDPEYELRTCACS